MTSTTNTTGGAERADIYQRITDQIAAAIEAGAGRYEMPWHRAAGVPMNASSRKPYRGINTIMLWAAAQAKGYPSDIWATFKQWKELGASVRKGETATSIVFWKISDPKDPEGEAEDGADEATGRRSRVLARGYAVFNAAQVDGYDAPVMPVLPPAERVDGAEQFFAGLGADICHGGARAYYAPSPSRPSAAAWLTTGPWPMRPRIMPYSGLCRMDARSGKIAACSPSMTRHSSRI